MNCIMALLRTHLRYHEWSGTKMTLWKRWNVISMRNYLPRVHAECRKQLFKLYYNWEKRCRSLRCRKIEISVCFSVQGRTIVWPPTIYITTHHFDCTIRSVCVHNNYTFITITQRWNIFSGFLFGSLLVPILHFVSYRQFRLNETLWCVRFVCRSFLCAPQPCRKCAVHIF